MSKVETEARLPEPAQASADYINRLKTRLYDIFRQYGNAINSGVMWAGSGTAAPTTGTWAQGDMVKNTTPSEAGSASSKYVVIGWVCTVGGTPGTWLAMRTLTGN